MWPLPARLLHAAPNSGQKGEPRGYAQLADQYQAERGNVPPIGLSKLRNMQILLGGAAVFRETQNDKWRRIPAAPSVVSLEAIRTSQ
jgi:hypothetical protein